MGSANSSPLPVGLQKREETHSLQTSVPLHTCIQSDGHTANRGLQLYILMATLPPSVVAAAREVPQLYRLDTALFQRGRTIATLLGLYGFGKGGV